MQTSNKWLYLVQSFRTLSSRQFHASISKRLHLCSCCQQYKQQDNGGLQYKDYGQNFRRSIDNPEDYWAEHAEDIIWDTKWDKVLDNSNPPFTKWFVGGKLNTCYNAVDRHVDEGNGERLAIIHESPVTNTMRKITFKELQHEVSHFAGVLSKHGVKKGDRVLIYMPMIPEAVVAMLASARLGAIHSLVFGGFASKELSTRIEHAKPTVIVSASCGVEPGKQVPYKPLLDGALSMTNFQPNKCIIYNRPGFDVATMVKGRDLDYKSEMESARPTDCVPVPAMDPMYLLYTSGTTGLPKAVVRPSGGHAVVLKWSMWNIYGIKPGEVWWAASDLGWIVGHSYIAYAPLLNGNTSVMFEGKPVGTPDAGVYFRIIKEHNIAGLFVAPTALRAIRREDPKREYGKKYMPISSFRNMFVAGEHCDKETMEWTKEVFDCPVLDNWWQTETGWAITSTCVGLSMKLHPMPGVTGKPVPGWDVKVHREDGSETADHELGQIVVRLPLPPGSFCTLWENDERFKNTYFDLEKNIYNTMDSGYRNEEGYIAVMSRSDDVINVAGHRLSTGALEEAIIESPYIAEAAVIGVADSLKGQVPLGLCVPKHGMDAVKSKDVIEDVVKQVRRSIGPVASFKLAVLVPKLPKTRSGKIARNTIAAMAEGKPFQIPAAIEDASVYSAIESALSAIGYPPDDDKKSRTSSSDIPASH